MQATQSSTALMGLAETIESRSGERLSAPAARRVVSLRLDLGIVEEVPYRDGPNAAQAWVAPKASAAVDDSWSLLEDLLTGAQRRGTRSREVSGRGDFDNRSAHSRPGMNVAGGVGLAHDAGNLLSALGLYADLLAMPGVLHEQYREYASELRLLSERSSAMVQQMFDYIARTKEKAGGELTSLAEAIARCSGLLNRIAGRRVEVSFGRGADRLVDISVEAVERIVSNLVKNAAEAIGDENAGSIVVHVAGVGVGRGAGVALTVEDNGCGMTRAELSALGACGGPLRGRRGIGFRVVRELAALSNGCVAVASAPGEGTRVSVEWPSVEEIEIEVGERTKRVMRGEAGWIAC